MAGDPKGFLKLKRHGQPYRPVCERVRDFCHVIYLRTDAHAKEQAIALHGLRNSFLPLGLSGRKFYIRNGMILFSMGSGKRP